MAETFGERRKQLLRHLLRNRAGATMKELVQVLGVSRTAVRQHVAALTRDGFVARGAVLPSGGRPKRLLALTAAGREAVPRRYSWFGELVLEAVEQRRDLARARTAMRRVAAAVVAQEGRRRTGTDGGSSSVETLANVMDRLGYDARMTRDAEGEPAIEADNCIFHDLAMKHPEVCQFDLALLSAYTGRRVELHDCMARGGHVCRFRFMSSRS